MRLVVQTVAATLLAALVSSAALAQAYPSKPVTFISPYAPGGTTDILARILAPRLQQALGQPFLVEYRPGAGGNVGTDMVARSAPDGHTILMGASGPLSINVTLFKKLPYDPTTDLVPVVHVASVPLLLVTHPTFPAKSVRALIEMLKAKPDAYSYASAGTGTPQHLSAELFKLMTGTRATHIPYKGSGPAINDLMGGQVPFGFESMIAVLQQVKGGKLQALGVTDTRRSPVLPDVPTVSEGGVPGYDAIAWYGVMAPKGTPPQVVAVLNAEMRKVLGSAEVKQRLLDLGSTDVAGPPEQFGAFIKSEIAKWGKVVKASGASAD
jgi:tripartite-type tricarboxylate transporter receptor subunit TctC